MKGEINIQNFEIYLAGGMEGMSEEQTNTWRKYTKEYLEEKIECKKYNVCVSNPNDYYNLFSKPLYKTDREVREFDLNKVRNSKLIIVNFNSPRSIGTAQELAIANEHRIPVIGLNFNNCYDLHPWLKVSCNRIFDDLSDLLDYVVNFYLI